MSSSFDQPDDASSWRWNCGKVRSTHEMLSDVDAALNLVEEMIKSEAADSPSTDDLLIGQAGFFRENASVVSEAQHCVTPDPDFGNFGEPLLVVSACFLLQQIAVIQDAVSVAIVTSQCEQCPSELDSSNHSCAELGRDELGLAGLDHAHGSSDKDSQSHSFQGIHISTRDLGDFRCCQCHPSEQPFGIWLKVARAAGRSSFLFPTDVKADNAQRGPVQDNDLLFPVSLGIETKTLYVAFDGQKFVKVAHPGGDAEAAKSSTGHSTGGSSAGESYPEQAVGEKEGKSPCLQRRNEMLWGPHWTEGTRAEKDSSHADESVTAGPSPEGSVDNEVFRPAADQRRALPGSDAARSRLRKTAAKSRCLQYTATQETCRAVPLFSRNSAGCHDRRSCKVRDRKGDQ